MLRRSRGGTMNSASQPRVNRKIIRGTLAVSAAMLLIAIFLSQVSASSLRSGTATAAAVSTVAASPSGGCSVPNFGPPTSYPAGGNPVAVKIGDFNNDGKPDVAVADYISDEVSVLLGNGSGGFGSPASFQVG